MDAGDRLRLLDRRARVQARLKRRADGQYCDAVLVAMRRGRVRAARVSVAEQMAAARPFTLLPGRDERVDWTQVAGGRRRFWTDKTQRAGMLDEALDDLGIAADRRLLIVFHPSFAGVRTTRAGLTAHADAVLDANPEVWICPTEGADWLIESADMDVSWARFGGGGGHGGAP